MLRFTLRRFAISAYSLFMKEQKNHPKLIGLPVGKRGKVTATLYKALSPKDKKALMKRAEAVPSPTRAVKGVCCDKSKPKKRTPTPYIKFVKANINKFEKLPQPQRMKAVAKLWQTQKKKM